MDQYLHFSPEITDEKRFLRFPTLKINLKDKQALMFGRKMNDYKDDKIPDVLFPSMAISREHANIENKGGRIILTHLGFHSITWVFRENWAERLDPGDTTQLIDGDIVQLGEFRGGFPAFKKIHKCVQMKVSIRPGNTNENPPPYETETVRSRFRNSLPWNLLREFDSKKPPPYFVFQRKEHPSPSAAVVTSSERHQHDLRARNICGSEDCSLCLLANTH